MVNLDYTGHPLFDIGLAVVVCLAEKHAPAELMEDDLSRAANFIEEHYTQPPLTSFLTVAFPNSGFTNPAFQSKPELRQAYARRVARGFGEGVPHSPDRCVFTGKPALGYTLSVSDHKGEPSRQLPGRAFRQHIPLITAEEVINFFPWGDCGLPVSGEALLCLQLFPMGCRKCAGRLLAIHSDHPQILQAAVNLALEENIAALSQARLLQSKKLGEAASSAPTLLIETILELSRRQERANRRREPFSITAYHLTNSGQSSPLDERQPMLSIYRLPLQLTRFLQAAHDPRYQRDWQRLVARGHRLAGQARKKGRGGNVSPEQLSAEQTDATTYVPNPFYRDLLRLPQQANKFLQQYFLPPGDAVFHEQVDSASPGSIQASELALAPVVRWPLIALFLQEVLSMERDRIIAIQQLGDALARYVQIFDDQRFLRNFYQEQQGEAFRTILLRAARRVAARKEPPLIPLELFCSVFLSDDGENLRFDWKFARDLLFLRMLEWLYEHDQANLAKRTEDLSDEEEE
ncbi:type I-B CRISPR-associated protein Cas8b1/Cst1 [Thermogemmatispora onikobensis]|uniref:type I-B CRISPR-associated protein Cas8b1/Cst1 n=1 Tax=Thermogemmatispora onikobensis TaxID=732234 RepID=UPI000852E0F6|nr:type I-B CRISPR-associated protein Cas8b1/Cst1 [Thermogemmatispora onikobensis]